MSDPVSFSVRCPKCRNDVTQVSGDRGEVSRLLMEDNLHFYCDLCDYEWEPSFEELANVEYILAGVR